VASHDVDLPHGVDFWINTRFDPRDVGHGLNGILRVKAGTTLPRLRSELAIVWRGSAATSPPRTAAKRKRIAMRKSCVATRAKRVVMCAISSTIAGTSDTIAATGPACSDLRADAPAVRVNRRVHQQRSPGQPTSARSIRL